MSRNRQFADHEPRITSLEALILPNDLETIVKVVNPLSAGYEIDLSDPSGDITVDGPSQFIGDTEEAFNENAKFRVLWNGQDVKKGREIVWVNKTTFKLGKNTEDIDVTLDTDEELTLLFTPIGASVARQTLKGFITEFNKKIDEIARDGVFQWQPNTFYKLGQRVLFDEGSGLKMYETNTEHTSTSTFEASKWDVVLS